MIAGVVRYRVMMKRPVTTTSVERWKLGIKTLDHHAQLTIFIVVAHCSQFCLIFVQGRGEGTVRALLEHPLRPTQELRRRHVQATTGIDDQSAYEQAEFKDTLEGKPQTQRTSSNPSNTCAKRRQQM